MDPQNKYPNDGVVYMRTEQKVIIINILVVEGHERHYIFVSEYTNDGSPKTLMIPESQPCIPVGIYPNLDGFITSDGRICNICIFRISNDQSIYFPINDTTMSFYWTPCDPIIIEKMHMCDQIVLHDFFNFLNYRSTQQAYQEYQRYREYQQYQEYQQALHVPQTPQEESKDHF